MLSRPIADIKKFVRINLNLKDLDMEPFLRRAEEKIIVPYIGRQQYDIIVTGYAGGSLTAIQTELLDHISGAVYNYAILLAIPGLNLHISSAGITQQHTENTKPAFQHAVRELERSLMDAAYEYVEGMMQFLEDNAASFPVWMASAYYNRNKDRFINTGTRFNELYNIQCKHQTFRALYSTMVDVECMHILPAIGQAYHDLLKSEILAKNISAENATPIAYIQHIVANLTIAKGIRSNWLVVRDGRVIQQEIAAYGDSSSVESTAHAQAVAAKVRDCELSAHQYMEKLLAHLHGDPDTYTDFAAFTAAEAEEEDCCSSEPAASTPRSSACGDENAFYAF